MQRREELKLSCRDLAEKIGISTYNYYALESCKVSPVNKQTSKWKKSVIQISEFYFCEPEELFPEEIQKIQETKIEKKLDFDDIPFLQSQIEPLLLSPYEKMEENEKIVAIRKVLATGLTKRQEQILKYRFYENLTLKEIGDKLGVSRERIRTIESQALRRLRHPSRARYLKGYYQ